MIKPVQIISAPTILGLKPTGVERLPDTLMSKGLRERLGAEPSVITLPDMNDRYHIARNLNSMCLNPGAVLDYASTLMTIVKREISAGKFPLVLGGDCSVLIGIGAALKSVETAGLVFMDAHADYYRPTESVTGEIADMELGIVTGGDPVSLSNIDNQSPYWHEEHVIHLGQRDEAETIEYESRDIRKSSIRCVSFEEIQQMGMWAFLRHIHALMEAGAPSRYWIHFDTDVINDIENPAVDYRLPGGLLFTEVAVILRSLIASGRIIGMSVTIYNPSLDPTRVVAERINLCLQSAFASRQS